MTRDEMFKKHAGLVGKYIKVYPDYYYEDLKQEGYIGLLEAIDKYDPAKGKFSTFAYIHIKKRVVLFFKQKIDLIRIPNHRHNKKEIEKYRKKVDTDEIGEKEGLEGCERVGVDKVDYEEKAINKVMLEKFLDGMEDRWKKAVLMRLQGYKYREIGKELGLSKQRVMEKLENLKGRI